MNEQINQCKALMEKSISHLKSELSRLRVGRASVSMVEGVKVEVYGSAMSLKECAALSTPDARTIAIQPWDKSVIADIEKGILAANIGLTPINDGKLIRVNLPQITEERRRDFVKQIKKFGEDTKVAIRNHRRDTLDSTKGNGGGSSEDEMRRFHDEIQKLTDHFIAETDKLVESKSKEVMTI